jgi:hypothetical protein
MLDISQSLVTYAGRPLMILARNLTSQSAREIFRAMEPLRKRLWRATEISLEEIIRNWGNWKWLCGTSDPSRGENSRSRPNQAS